MLVSLCLFPACGSPSANQNSTPANVSSVNQNSAPPKTPVAVDRETVVSRVKEKFAKTDAEISVSGDKKDILIVKSKSLSDAEITATLTEFFVDLKAAGFTEIQTVASKRNEKSTINLATLKSSQF